MHDFTPRDYIPVQLWRDSYQPPFFTFVEKVPISKIKIDNRLFAWQNRVSPSRVDFIVENFDIDFWMPIIVNSDYYLLDGQHRLRVANKLKLKYVDAIIVEEILDNHNSAKV